MIKNVYTKFECKAIQINSSDDLKELSENSDFRFTELKKGSALQALHVGSDFVIDSRVQWKAGNWGDWVIFSPGTDVLAIMDTELYYQTYYEEDNNA